MKHLAVILLAVLLVSCSREPKRPPIVLTGLQVEELLQSEGIFGFPVISDRAYAAPDLAWLTDGPFAKRWSKASEELGPYNPESRDCDDFARGAAWCAQVEHSKDPDRPLGTAIAVGEFFYSTTRNTKHAILVAVCRMDGTNLAVAFFEPQSPPRFIRLDQVEYESCEFFRF